MTNTPTSAITSVRVQMYKMGTGDCFVLKFMRGSDVAFKMLIDCGVWQGKFAHIQKYVEVLKEEVDHQIDVLVITHEHKDHVYGFEAAADLFAKHPADGEDADNNDKIKVDQIWMGWTENEADPKVAEWQKANGKKKRALALAAQTLQKRLESPEFEAQFKGSKNQQALFGLRQRFAGVLDEFAGLHVSGEDFADSLAGMAVVKKQIANNNISYFKPGDIIENLPGLDGVRVYVLGPPEVWELIKQESGHGEEAYEHNNELEEADLMVQAFMGLGEEDDELAPFDAAFATTKDAYAASYEHPDEAWRRIDDDWLFSSGSFALRLNNYINNLSLVLAIEFVDSGKVMLFPGDAEIGSWKSWHDIKWQDKGLKDLTTEKLLNRVVFYKVAHHLSHNGTARSIGLDMMTHPDLVAMATLDYDVISNGWKSTMPNRLLVRDLLEKSKGRLLITNETGLSFDLEGKVPLSDQIQAFRSRMTDQERQAFQEALHDDHDQSDFLIEYEVKL